MIDLCVVGSGIAGAMIAYEAARAGQTVVILETGKRYQELDPDRYDLARLQLYPWPWEQETRDAFEVDSQLSVRLNGSRIKAVGGTTLHWSAYAPRLQPADFEMRGRFGIGSDWPLSYNALEPYYMRAEMEMGVAGGPTPGAPPRSGPYPLPAHPYSFSDEEFFRPAFEAAGLHLGPNPMAVNSEAYDDRSRCIGFTTCAPMCGSGAKYTAMVHIRKAEATGNVEVRSECHVRRIRLAGSRRVDRVEYVDAQGETRSLDARAFVLAAGGIENPRLLLLSARDGAHAEGLGNASGMVGRQLMFHTLSGVRGTLQERVGGHRIGFGTAISWDLHDHSRLPERGNMVLFPADLQGPLPGDIARSSGLWGAALKEHVRQAYGSNVKIIAMGEMLPYPGNRVTLSPTTTDRFGDPVPHLSVELGAFENSTIEHGIEIGRDLIGRAGAREIWTDSGAFGGHYIGTTAMGVDPASSVCDEFGRCHELDNLYIAGSSTFSTSSASHPTLTIAALALRTADHLVRSI